MIIRLVSSLLLGLCLATMAVGEPARAEQIAADSPDFDEAAVRVLGYIRTLLEHQIISSDDLDAMLRGDVLGNPLDKNPHISQLAISTHHAAMTHLLSQPHNTTLVRLGITDLRNARHGNHQRQRDNTSETSIWFLTPDEFIDLAPETLSIEGMTWTLSNEIRFQRAPLTEIQWYHAMQFSENNRTKLRPLSGTTSLQPKGYARVGVASEDPRTVVHTLNRMLPQDTKWVFDFPTLSELRFITAKSLYALSQTYPRLFRMWHLPASTQPHTVELNTHTSMGANAAGKINSVVKSGEPFMIDGQPVWDIFGPIFPIGVNTSADRRETDLAVRYGNYGINLEGVWNRINPDATQFFEGPATLAERISSRPITTWFRLLDNIYPHDVIRFGLRLVMRRRESRLHYE